MRPWFIRKLIHTCGLTIMGIYGSLLTTLDDIILIVGIVLAILGILTIIPQIQILQKLISMGTREGQTEKESTINTVFTTISVFALLIVFIDTRWLFLAGVLSVGWGDGLGEFIGRPFGKHKFKIISEKSVEGSFGVFLGTFLGIIFAILLLDPFEISMFVITISLVSAIAASIVEALSISFIDNVVMPFLVAGILWFNLGN